VELNGDLIEIKVPFFMMKQQSFKRFHGDFMVILPTKNDDLMMI
jgi:hypothetical protein